MTASPLLNAQLIFLNRSQRALVTASGLSASVQQMRCMACRLTSQQCVRRNNCPQDLREAGMSPGSSRPLPFVLRLKANRSRMSRPIMGPAFVLRGGPGYGRASSTMLNGVSAARRTVGNPLSWRISARRLSPAWAPSAVPTSCPSEQGTHTLVEKA